MSVIMKDVEPKHGKDMQFLLSYLGNYLYLLLFIYKTQEDIKEIGIIYIFVYTKPKRILKILCFFLRF